MDDIQLIEQSNEIITDHCEVICDYLDEWSAKCSDKNVSLAFLEIIHDIKNKSIANAVLKLIFVIKIIVNGQIRTEKNIAEEDCTYILDLALGVVNALAINQSTYIRGIIKENSEEML